MPDLTQSPRYQRRVHRARRKLRDMPAAERTMLDILAGEIGGEEMRKKVRSTQLATAKESRQASLQLGERGLRLKSRQFEFQKSQIVPATLIGIGEVGLGVYGGIERRKTSQALARWYLGQQSQYTTPTAPTGRPYR